MFSLQVLEYVLILEAVWLALIPLPKTKRFWNACLLVKTTTTTKKSLPTSLSNSCHYLLSPKILTGLRGFIFSEPIPSLFCTATWERCLKCKLDLVTTTPCLIPLMVSQFFLDKFQTSCLIEPLTSHYCSSHSALSSVMNFFHFFHSLNRTRRLLLQVFATACCLFWNALHTAYYVHMVDPFYIFISVQSVIL